MKKNTREILSEYDKYSFYTDGRIERDIENNRKGGFVLQFEDEKGNAVNNVKVSIKQINHAFNFGCSAFLLDEFDEDWKNEKYKEYFKKLFNYATVPLYWDTLEPERGKPRFGKDSEKIYRRPPIDLIVEFCEQNNIRMKGHCLMYHSFNPKWIPTDHRELKMAIVDRLAAISEKYSRVFHDVDVINELHSKYKCLYGMDECALRNFPVADEKDHVNWCFEMAKKYFPYSKLHWNEGCYETFGDAYVGEKSFYYLMLEHYISQGVPIESIGMQFHAFGEAESNNMIYNPVRLLDVFDKYSDFGLPIHLSEISIPSYSNEEEDEYIQAELVKRLYTLWFSQKNIDGAIWWNLVDGTAYGDENKFFAGILRNDMTPKPAFKELDNLINRKWHTELVADSDNGNIISFNGFYGEYKLDIEANGKKIIKHISLKKDNTGYYHSREQGYGLRKTKIVL